MSDQDDTLLDEDLGDEEYDLGNDEEEALLADDYEIDRQNSYKGEEETDDVLDLGVTDALDDLEGDDENISYRNESDSHNQTHCYTDERIVDCHGGYYDHEEQPQLYEENIGHNEALLSPTSMSTGDLREKLQKNNNSAQRDVVIIGNGQQQQLHHHLHHHHQQPMEDDDGEEARERRNRFQSERTIISPKMNHEIPDSLESVVTMEQMRPMMMRDRGRGRGIRGMRGARFLGPMPSYNPRFSSRGPSYNDQKPSFRPPLLESRPPLFPNGPPNNMMNPQMMYHQGNPQHVPRFQQYQGGPPVHVPGHHFNDPSNGLRPQYNQFPGMGQVPRMQNPRMEFRPRAPGPRFNGPPNQPQFMPPRPTHFQARPQQHGPEVRPMPNNNEPMMSSGPRGPSLLGPGPHPMGPHGPNNQIRPTHPGHPRMLPQGAPCGPNGPSGMDGQIAPRFARPGPNHIANHPNVPMGAQPPFENRPPFQQAPQFERRNIYAPGQQPQQQHQQQQQYNNQPVANQFNNNMPPGPQQQRGSAVPNVPIPPGHKILINPHFRGTPQPPADGRPQWDGSQQPMPQPQVPNEQNFVQSTTSYQDPVAYNQTPVKQQTSQEFPKSKNDDPYAYFSDVWQENKTPKPKSISPLKSYSAESNYSRDSNYRDYDSKYKSSDTRDTYPEDQRYRDRSPPARSREYSHRPRPHQSNTSYHSDTYEQRSSRPTNNLSSSRASSRPPQKRSPEPLSRSGRESSPKRVKSSHRNFHDSPSSETNISSRSKHVDDLDPEMREYHKKMEEQKRLREKILQEKENRRKQAAMEKHGDESRDVKISENAQQDDKMSSGAAVVPKNNAESVSQPLTSRGRIRTGNTQASEVREKGLSGVRIVRKPPGSEKHTASTNHNIKESIVDGQNDGGQSRASIQQQQQQSSARRVVINAPCVQRVATSIHKTVSNLQKNPTTMSTTANTTQKVSNKLAAVSKNATLTDNTRTVIKDGAGSTGPLRKVVVNNAVPANSKKSPVGNSTFQRIVLQPNTKPNTIVIENLATSTSEAEIRKMCQGIGTLESVLMGDKTATIVFKTHSAATVFQKKYQRKMIDLSMINVRLLNQTVSIKRPTIK